jgi:4-amino-4-deoxy-L-arabinose transferase-like glycosyltransferase
MMPPSPATPVRVTHLRLPVPLPGPWFWGFIALYAAMGLVGHDPWKNDDATGFGIAWSMASGGVRDWLLPNVAGQYIAEEGPLAFWLAALFIKIFDPWLTAFDAARLSAAVWSIAAVYCVHLAARELWGQKARHAALCLLACAGLLVRTHEISAEPALLFACAYTLWAMVHWRHAPLALPTGLALGVGLALAWLARGPHAAFPLVLAVLGAPFVIREWRNPRGALAAVIAVAAAALVWLWWPKLAGAAVPEFRASYFAWVQRQFGFPNLADWRYYAKTVAWFAFPAWPVALWWLLRRPPAFLGEKQSKQLHPAPLLFAATALISLAWSRESSESVLLPLLPPLALIAAPAVSQMRRGAANMLDWFGRMTFTLAAALIWLGYVAMQVGWPPKIAYNFAKLEPGFRATFEPLPFVVALAATLLWLVVVARSERTPLRGITHWCYGITLSWTLVMTLLLPWIDYGKTYRPVALGVRVALLADAGSLAGERACLASRQLGPAQRASLQYMGELRFGSEARCRYLIVQGVQHESPPVPRGWVLLWQGNRPGDRDERFRLYKRQSLPDPTETMAGEPIPAPAAAPSGQAPA